MTTAAPPPPTPHAQANVEDFDIVSAVPHSNQHAVGTGSWQNHDSSPPSMLLYCTAMVAYVYQTPTFPPHYGDNVKVKSQHICQAIPALLRGSGEAVVTNDWCIIYSLWITSHENLVVSHPQKYIDPKHKIWHPLLYFSIYFQVHSHSITSSIVRGLNEHYFYWMSLFSLESRLPGEPCNLFLLSIIVARNHDAYFALPGLNKSVFGINR